MAIVMIEGFEGGTLATSGLSSAATSVYSTSDPRPRPGGAAGARSLSRTTAAANEAGMVTVTLPWNADRGRLLRLREVSVGYAQKADGSQFPSSPAFNTTGLSVAGLRQAGAIVSSSASRAYRSGTTLGPDGTGTNASGLWTTLWVTVRIATGSNGFVRVQDAGTLAVLLDNSGNTQALTEDYATAVTWGVSANGAKVDDFVVLAPSLRLTNVVGVAGAGVVLTGSTSGAQVTVSDDEPSKGRWWVHSWNGTPFIAGEAITGAGFTAVLVAPSPAYLNGFEPRSFPFAGLPYVLTVQPTANGIPQTLTPVPAGSAVTNINVIPENAATYNEATSGVAEADRYITPSALPSWVQQVVAVQADPVVTMSGAYTTVQADLTDTTGSQQVRSNGTTAPSWRARSAFPFRADGTDWTLLDAAAMAIRYSLEP